MSPRGYFPKVAFLKEGKTRGDFREDRVFKETSIPHK